MENSNKQKIYNHENPSISIRKNTLEELKRKARYYDLVLASPTTYTSSEIAADLGLSSPQKLHDFLVEKKVIKKSGDIYVLCSKYAGKGYMKSRTMLYSDKDNEFMSKIVFAWTEAGREFIWGLFQKDADTVEEEG